MAKRFKRAEKDRYNINYSYIHSYERLRNLREVLFLKERFICRNDKENNEFVSVLEKETFDRESATKHSRGISPDNWSLNITLLDDYVSGEIEIQRVIGDKTKFCGFYVDSDDNDCAKKAAKNLYHILREKFKIPSYAIIIYEDGWCGYYVLVLFYRAVHTLRVVPFQNSVINCTADGAMNCGASVEVVAKKQEAIRSLGMSFGYLSNKFEQSSFP